MGWHLTDMWNKRVDVCFERHRKVWQSIYILDMPQEWQFTLFGIVDEIQTRHVRVCNYWIIIQSSLFFTGINSQLKNKFIRFSCLSSHSGDMILTVKHNVVTFCLVAINNNLFSRYHSGIPHRWLLLCYKTWDLQALKYSKDKDKKMNKNAGKERNKMDERSVQDSTQCVTTIICPLDLLLADMLRWPLLTLSAIISP